MLPAFNAPRSDASKFSEHTVNRLVFLLRRDLNPGQRIGYNFNLAGLPTSTSPPLKYELARTCTAEQLRAVDRSPLLVATETPCSDATGCVPIVGWIEHARRVIGVRMINRYTSL
jgi:hypothetical protein